jgi:hypothetical protein
VCEGKNIRRDGKRSFVYLCIGVFTNKITALDLTNKNQGQQLVQYAKMEEPIWNRSSLGCDFVGEYTDTQINK